jgi:hypothetical protein
MIDIGKIIKRSWHILWNYRILWIFGILLALTGGGSGEGVRYSFGSNSGNTGSSNYNPNYQPGPVLRQLTDWFNQNVNPLFDHPNQHVGTLIGIGVAFVFFILLIIVITTFVRYVSESAALRMVDEYEQTGVKVGFKQGWRLGWSRRAFRMWVIDLVVGLPAFVFVLLLGGLGMLIFLSVTSHNTGLAVGGTVLSIGLAFLFILAFFLLAVFLGLLRQFFVRAAALEGLRIGDSFRQGWATFKANWKSAALMWLVMLGIGIGFGIVTAILFFLFIPAYIILAVPGLIVAAIPGLIAFGITSIFSGGVLAWIIGILVALPFFFTVVLAPLTLVSALYTLFNVNIWTLTYREMKALEGLKPAETPAPPITPAA